MGDNCKFAVNIDVSHIVSEYGSPNSAAFSHGAAESGDFLIDDFSFVVNSTSYVAISLTAFLNEVDANDLYFLSILHKGAMADPVLLISFNNVDDHSYCFPGMNIFIYPKTGTETLYAKKAAAGNDFDIEIHIIGYRA